MCFRSCRSGVVSVLLALCALAVGCATSSDTAEKQRQFENENKRKVYSYLANQAKEHGRVITFYVDSPKVLYPVAYSYIRKLGAFVVNRKEEAQYVLSMHTGKDRGGPTTKSLLDTRWIQIGIQYHERPAVTVTSSIIDNDTEEALFISSVTEKHGDTSYDRVLAGAGRASLYRFIRP